MEHNDVRHKLSEYIDDSISIEERAAIEEHLKTCDRCSNALTELRKTVEHVKALEEVEAPLWMTQKIMAQVRADTEKKTWAQRLFQPLLIKLPIQAIAVAFLAIGAFYMFKNTQPAPLPSEVGTQDFAAERSAPPPSQAKKDKHAGAYDAAPRAQRAPQAPEYKALDMKQEYEKPAAPRPAEAPVFSKKESAYAPPQAAAPSMLQEKAGAGVGSASRPLAKQKAPEQYAVDSASTNAVAGGSVSNKGQLPPAIANDLNIIQKLMAYFADHDLPTDMKKTGLKIAPSKVKGVLADMPEIDDSLRKTLAACPSAYQIKAELVERKQVYFYCTNNEAIRLLGKYELKNGAWTVMH